METGFATVTENEGVSVTSGQVNGFSVAELAFPPDYVQRPFDPELPYLAGGETFKFNVDVTCMNVYGNRAKIGGVIKQSSDPTLPPGMFAWFQVFDNGEGANAPPDQSSLVGFGDEVANEAFCNSPNLPRFGPWDVQGNVQVRA